QALATNRTLDFWRTPHGIFGAHAMVPGKLGALFAGQGAQYVNMGRDLACQFPQMRRALEAAQTHTPLDLPLRDVIYPPAAFGHAGESLQSTALRQTAAAQPAIGAIATGMLNVLVDFGIDFAAAAGHSYGELVALHAMGHFDETTLHRLSGQRGQHMSGGSGAMLAVMAERSVVDALISKSNLDVVVANHNTPTQVVVSGSQAGIDAAQEAFATAGLRTIALSVSAGFHSPQVAAATSAFADDVQDVSWQPGKPIYSNTTAQPYPEDRQAKQEILAHHLAQPVDFVGILHNMYAEGVRTFVEIGPGRSLCGMVQETLDTDVACIAIDASTGKDAGEHDLAKALAFLAARGHAVALELWDNAPPSTPERTYSAAAVQLTGANFRQPTTPRPKRHAPDTSANISQQAIPNVQLPTPLTTVTPTLSSPAKGNPVPTQSMQALIKLHEDTAKLHQQFLLGQQQLVNSISALAGLPNVVSATTPSHSSVEFMPTATPADLAVSPSPTQKPLAPVKPTGVSEPTTATQNVLLAVIAEKTGYPVDMLNLDMGLDSDLGIDSIKRVEILAALQEKLPHAPVIKPEHLGSLHTLGDIAEFLAADGASGIAGQNATQTSFTPHDDAAAIFFFLLVGLPHRSTLFPYTPIFRLGLDSDLGIDSIKRVEILAALQEKLPHAPVIKPE
ncbi:MAG: acyltransferase domain-containing protein, partial [Caldilineaceae bacterium]|nr:acyltransferase domain-containing protein [Caldilineaceae bacterium]